MNRKKTIIFSAIILTFLIGASFTITYLVDQNNQKENPIYITDSGAISIINNIDNVSNIEINNKIKDLAVSFEFLPDNSPLLIKATWNYTYTKSIFVPDNPIQIEISNETEDNVLQITFDENVNIFFPNLQDWECVIQITQDFEIYRFSSDSKGGDIDFFCDLDITFETFEISTTTGEIYVQLNHSKIENDINLESKSGDIYLWMDLLPIGGNLICYSDSGYLYFNLWNIQFCSNAQINVLSDVGFIDFRWAQHIFHNNSVIISLESHMGVEFRHWSPKEFVKYEVFLEAANSAYLSGTTNIDLWEQIDTNHYQSKNFNETELDFLQIFMKSLELNVWAKTTDCFKAIRICNPTSDTFPYDVYEVGAYNITEAETSFSGTSIELHNNTANVNITIGDDLSVSSPNIFEIYWDLTYVHGSMYGYGSLKINCSYEIIDNTIEIYINLDYAYDRIRPLYYSGEFNVSVHPDYTFSIIN
jgi:hypothetical protein